MGAALRLDLVSMRPIWRRVRTALNVKGVIVKKSLSLLLAGLGTLAIVISISSIGCGAPPGPGAKDARDRSPQAVADSLADVGWESVFENRFSDASRQFGLAISTDAKNLRAHRGLVVANVLSGNDESALNRIQVLSRQKPLGLPSEYLLHGLCNTFSRLLQSNPELWLDYLKNLENADSLSVGETRRIQSDRLDIYLDKGNVEAVRFLADRLNYITAWSFLGPFDNDAGCGHGRIAVSAESPGTEYTGKHQLPVRWSAPGSDYAPIDGVLGLGNYFPRAESATGYAISTLAATESVACLFSISHQGAINVLLNGTEIYSHERYSGRREQVHVRARLQAGENQLLVEASEIETTPRFSIGVSQLDGKPFGGLSQSSAVRPAVTEAESARPKHLKVPFLDSSRENYEKGPDDPEALLWYLAAVHQFAVEEDIRPVLREVGDRHEDAAIIQMMKALLFSKVDEPAKFRQIVHRVSEVAPACIPNGATMIRELISLGQVAKAEELHDTLHDLAPESVELTLLNMELAAERGRKSAAKNIARKVVRTHPELTPAYSHLTGYYASIGDAELHNRYRDEWLAQLPAILHWSGKQQDAVSRNDFKDAAEYAKLLSQLAPDSPSFAASHNYLSLLAGDYRGIQGLELALASFPYSLELLDRLADIYEATERPDDARRLQKRILVLDPLNFEVRNALRANDDLPSIEEILSTPAFGDYVPSDSALAAVETGTPALILADIDRRIVLGDGANIGSRYTLIKVLTDKGVAAMGRRGLELGNGTMDYNILEARTIKPDGRHIEAEQMGPVVAFQSLTPGDIIELSYRTTSLQPGVLASEVWDHFFFQWSDPCLYAEYALLVPNDLAFESRLHNTTLEQVHYSTEDVEKLTKHTWTMSNMPAYWTEFHAPPAREHAPWLDISTIDHWGEITSWYDRYTTWPTTVTEQVRENAERLTGHLTDPLDKTRALFCFVRDEIEYDDVLFGHGPYVPRQADDVLVSQYGDCKDQSALLIALLSACGIEADFVLTSTEMGNSPYLPSPRFIHAIVAAKVDGQTLYLDPTEEFLPFDRNYRPNAETSALAIRSAGVLQSWSGERPSAASDTVRISGRLDDDGILTARVSEVRHSRWGVAALRAESSLLREKDREELYAMALASTIPGCVVEDLDWQEANGEDATAGFTTTLRLQPLQFSPDGLALLDIGALGILTDDLASRVALPSRETDLLMNDVVRNVVQEIDITLPSSIRIHDLPEDITINGSSLIYERKMRARSGRLQGTRRLTVTSERVGVAEYGGFKASLDQALQDIGRAVVVKRR